MSPPLSDLPHEPGHGPARHRRRLIEAAAAFVVVAGLAGCASALPPVQWLRLPAEPPEALAPVAGVDAPAATATWQLMGPVVLPAYLDRDLLLRPQGAAGLQPVEGARWAEPLREAVPRLLRHDLSRSPGRSLWQAPLPPGLQPTHQLRLELLAFDVTPDGRGVALQARWSLADLQRRAAPVRGEAAFTTPAAGSEPQALVLAHRQALAGLAARIAASALR